MRSPDLDNRMISNKCGGSEQTAAGKYARERIDLSMSVRMIFIRWPERQRKPAQVITELKMSLADSIPSATSAYELPTTPTPILMIMCETLMQIARIPSPSDSDVDGIVVSRPGFMTLNPRARRNMALLGRSTNEASPLYVRVSQLRLVEGRPLRCHTFSWSRQGHPKHVCAASKLQGCNGESAAKI
jgi:hypothetical protein